VGWIHLWNLSKHFWHILYIIQINFWFSRVNPAKCVTFSIEWTLEYKRRNKGDSYAIHNVNKFRTSYKFTHSRSLFVSYHYISTLFTWKERKRKFSNGAGSTEWRIAYALALRQGKLNVVLGILLYIPSEPKGHMARYGTIHLTEGVAMRCHRSVLSDFRALTAWTHTDFVKILYKNNANILRVKYPKISDKCHTITDRCWLLFNLIYTKLRDCSFQRFNFISPL
jgi:hypothetical protein